MKIVAFIPVYNEEDVIAEAIEYLISEGLNVVVLDNGSTDDTFEICKKFSNSGKIILEQIISDEFDESIVFEAGYHLAILLKPDWVMYSSADEIIESGRGNTSLMEIISEADSNGYNLIQFDRFDFFMTDKDYQEAKTTKEKMKYYSYLGDHLYRAWKFFPGIKMGMPGGHYPIFPKLYPYKISPTKGILRHYPFRSKEQAIKKMQNVLRSPNGTKKPFGSYARAIKNDYTQKIDNKILTKYNDDNVWNYKIKFNPYSWKNPPKKEDVFTEDGFLRNPQKTLSQSMRMLADERQKIIPYKIRRIFPYVAKKLKNR